MAEADWTALSVAIAKDPQTGLAALAEALAPVRIAGARVEVAPSIPEVLSRTPEHLKSGRHGAWFGERLPELAEAGWAAAMLALGWSAARQGDGETVRRSAESLRAGAALECDSDFEAKRACLSNAANFLDSLTQDLKQGVKAEGPLYWPGDLKEVSVVGGSDFIEQGGA